MKERIYDLCTAKPGEKITINDHYSGGGDFIDKTLTVHDIEIRSGNIITFSHIMGGEEWRKNESILETVYVVQVDGRKETFYANETDKVRDIEIIKKEGE